MGCAVNFGKSALPGCSDRVCTSVRGTHNNAVVAGSLGGNRCNGNGGESHAAGDDFSRIAAHEKPQTVACATQRLEDEGSISQDKAVLLWQQLVN